MARNRPALCGFLLPMAHSRRLYDPDPLPLQHSGPPHLAEPLTQSAAWVAAIAEWTCVRNGGLSCSWYHGTWQYLRLLDLVSTPSWHASLRKAMAAQSAHRTGLRVLVSGCADYAMYALVHSQLGGSGRITVLDICPTPLVGVSWYARKAGAPVPELIVADATKHCRPGYYDLVVSDSFPPRFSENKLHSLLPTWYESLSPGGAVITTVRLYSEGADANPQKGRRLHRWLQVAAEARSWWPEVSGLPHEELIRRISGFSAKQQRNAFFDASALPALFLGAGFEPPAITTHRYRKRDFALIASHKGPV